MRTADEVAALSGWHAQWAGLRVAVLGLGVTGFSVADTLVELGATTLVLASRADDAMAELVSVTGARLVVADLESEPVDDLVDFAPDLVVVSPGFAPRHPLVDWATRHGIPVWGDIELAWRLRDRSGTPARWLAVTGTNGKTTTVQLTAAMIAASGLRVADCGNVGVPVLDAIRDSEGFDVLVLELSSFQLHYTHAISPHSSVCLNVAADHLDWHGSAEAYRAAKARVYENTTVACVFNRDDETTRAMVDGADVVEGARAIGFGLGVPGPGELGIVDGILCDRAFLADRQRSAIELTTLADLAEVGLAAEYMVANVLAACALARSVGVEPAAIRAALCRFRLDHHRTETVASRDGVRWVDDSKATNPHAAEAALVSFDSVVWIVGGLLKGVQIDDLVSRQAARLRAVVVIGLEREPVLAAFARHARHVPVFEVVTLDTKEVMPTAVRLSAAAAERGDVVLLAPAAASMDQFSNYADRGRRFTAAVHEMLGDEADDDQPSAPASAPDR